jgi:hypothetical protein
MNNNKLTYNLIIIYSIFMFIFKDNYINNFKSERYRRYHENYMYKREIYLLHKEIVFNI